MPRNAESLLKQAKLPKYNSYFGKMSIVLSNIELN